ncbi:mitochondria protoheme IX farnesyltransferase [Metschnikowia bicuspidata var. bicuspidata NRRL YB-4993]|uniref:Protoheme IX farnesyltransferase, mitochondrial n=1 Tax=Metschnikowia bicuspidata var. bicuspidata NRRL YB-4993 TaxID=869754 RepID=A0A1A0HJ64_9ASCO|nr:mitochondria protoheme IX farnesyltransferase [Metschnikowia bicuspidata var. bicuspidata NRRL YB-4993]OBA23927.1 mitochondria protoheme IX farnesyltransferase [Metschnikowia bicuspidata var. bicuspidata NRRL YB-4993]
MFYRLAYTNKLNNASSFNFFFSNAKKGLQIDQNFISNAILLGSRKLRIKTGNISEGLPKPLKAKKHESQPFNVAFMNKKTVQKASSPRNKVKDFIKLTKPNLTVLVTLSSICSYAISPNSLSIAELAFLTVGTALCSGSANAINMGREPDFDRKMSRTSMRPVVTGKLSPTEAFSFAALTGVLGTTILYMGVNPTVAFLGLLNIGLYGWTYTSLKRLSILNTWVGAIVGAIPPLMGWAASTSLSHPGGWCLAALLYAWQFPHFNALSHNVADQYKGAGYVMTAAENPKLNARVALRYSLLMFPICVGLSYFEVTDWVFPFDSGVANFWLTMLAYRFWKQQRINHTTNFTPSKAELQAANIQAKQLFWCSVWQLPVVLVLAMLHKKGQWDRLWAFLGWKEGNVPNSHSSVDVLE